MIPGKAHCRRNNIRQHWPDSTGTSTNYIGLRLAFFPPGFTPKEHANQPQSLRTFARRHTAPACDCAACEGNATRYSGPPAHCHRHRRHQRICIYVFADCAVQIPECASVWNRRPHGDAVRLCRQHLSSPLPPSLSVSVCIRHQHLEQSPSLSLSLTFQFIPATAAPHRVRLFMYKT